MHFRPWGRLLTCLFFRQVSNLPHGRKPGLRCHANRDRQRPGTGPCGAPPAGGVRAGLRCCLDRRRRGRGRPSGKRGPPRRDSHGPRHASHERRGGDAADHDCVSLPHPDRDCQHRGQLRQGLRGAGGRGAGRRQDPDGRPGRTGARRRGAARPAGEAGPGAERATSHKGKFLSAATLQPNQRW